MLKQKLIIVEFVGGRCGSSLVMGLLNRAGVNTGPNNLHIEPDIWNQGGYYETLEVSNITSRDMVAITDPFTEIIDYNERKEFALSHKQKFVDMLKKTYKGNCAIAVKDNNGGILAMFDNEDPAFDVRIIFLDRNTEDQCKSIILLWNEGFGIEGHNRDKYFNWIEKEKKLVEEWIKTSKIPYIKLMFFKLLDDPIESTKKICELVDIPMLSENVIQSWINQTFSRSRTR